MTTIPLRWKLILTLFGIVCALIAVMGVTARTGQNWGFVALFAFFAVLLGILPWVNLRRMKVRRVVAMLLVLPLWGFAYVLIGGALTSPSEMDIGSKIGAIVLGLFAALLGLGLLAEAMEFRKVRPVTPDD